MFVRVQKSYRTLCMQRLYFATWNLATCNENGKYSVSSNNDSLITCNEIINTADQCINKCANKCCRHCVNKSFKYCANKFSQERSKI